MAKEKYYSELLEIRVKGVPPKTHDDLKTIAYNLGLSISSMMKPKLKEIVDSYPAELKMIKPRT